MTRRWLQGEMKVVKRLDKHYHFITETCRCQNKMEAQTETSKPLQPITTLLSEIIDYAGLFPPSQLSMQETVVNYATYRSSNYGWMLGRFILPVARLDEFYECANEFLPSGESEDEPWRLSVLAGEDVNVTMRQIAEFGRVHPEGVVIDTLEVKANTLSKIENTLNVLPKDISAYFEISTGEEFVDLVTAISMSGQRAKIRTGGVTNDDFPPSREIVRFVRTCMAANLPFKATAGLHHPLRCFKPLTYAPDAPQGTMHGFMNMLMMTAFARESFRPSLLEELMEEEFEEVFKFTESGISWRDEHFLSNGHLRLMRQRGMHSFGSCSFDEPVEDLRALGLL